MLRETVHIFLATCMVAVVTFAIGGPRPDRDPGPTAREINQLMENGEALLLDARPYVDFESGHIPGAINIPAHDPDKMDVIFHLEDMLRSAPLLVVYCTGPECELSEILAADLQSLEFPEETLLIFTGGMEAWQTAGYEISTDTGFQESLQH